MDSLIKDKQFFHYFLQRFHKFVTLFLVFLHKEFTNLKDIVSINPMRTKIRILYLVL